MGRKRILEFVAGESPEPLVQKAQRARHCDRCDPADEVLRVWTGRTTRVSQRELGREQPVWLCEPCAKRLGLMW